MVATYPRTPRNFVPTSPRMFAVTRHLTNYAINLSSPEALNIAAYSEPGCVGNVGNGLQNEYLESQVPYF